MKFRMNRRKQSAAAVLPRIEDFGAIVTPQNIRVKEFVPGAERAIMEYAITHWNRSITLQVSADNIVPQRLTMRAYAQVYGVRFHDENDSAPGHELTREDLAQLPKMRQLVRKSEGDAPSPGFCALRKVARFIMPCLFWGPKDIKQAATSLPVVWARHPTLSAASSSMPALYVLLGIAIGFRLENEGLLWIATIPFHYPHETWIAVRIACGVAFCAILLDLFSERKLLRRLEAISAYGSHAIDDFREKSAFGDANLAAKAEIARALTGRSDGLTPKFEE